MDKNRIIYTKERRMIKTIFRITKCYTSTWYYPKNNFYFKFKYIILWFNQFLINKITTNKTKNILSMDRKKNKWSGIKSVVLARNTIEKMKKDVWW